MALAKQNERVTYLCKSIIILKCKTGQINLATTECSVIDPCCLFSCLHQPKFAFAGARTMRMRCWSPQHLHCIFPVLFTIATLREENINNNNNEYLTKSPFRQVAFQPAQPQRTICQFQVELQDTVLSIKWWIGYNKQIRVIDASK